MTRVDPTRSIERGRGARFVRVLRSALDEWIARGAPTRSAAIAFYTLWSLAPVSILLVWAAGLVWEGDAVRARITEALTDALGADVASLVSVVLQDAASPGGGAFVAGLVALVTFGLSATAVFVQLRGALRDAWDLPPSPGHRAAGFFRGRLMALALVGLLAIVLAAAMGASVVVSALAALMPTRVSPFVRLAELGVSVATLIVLFTLVFRVLPDADVPWPQAGVGGLVTACLHVAGQWAVAYYLGRAGLGSAYGPAGSLVVFLSWVYYSSLVFLYGAHVTHELSEPTRRDSPISS